jgi:hypothetical protein
MKASEVKKKLHEQIIEQRKLLASLARDFQQVGGKDEINRLWHNLAEASNESNRCSRAIRRFDPKLQNYSKQQWKRESDQAFDEAYHEYNSSDVKKVALKYKDALSQLHELERQVENIKMDISEIDQTILNNDSIKRDNSQTIKDQSTKITELNQQLKNSNFGTMTQEQLETKKSEIEKMLHQFSLFESIGDRFSDTLRNLLSAELSDCEKYLSVHREIVNLKASNVDLEGANQRLQETITADNSKKIKLKLSDAINGPLTVDMRLKQTNEPTQSTEIPVGNEDQHRSGMKRP